MKGIDISHWNGFPFNSYTAPSYSVSDFVIVKATDGIRYSYAKTFFPKAIEKVLKDGKLGGAYHYATGVGTPVQEADYFISVVKPYIGKIILALDWEGQSNKAWGTRGWCKKFIDRVKEKTGVTCFLYTGMEGIAQNTELGNVCPLWFAGYPLNLASWTVPTWPKKYKTTPWKGYTIWQYSGNGVDRNVTALTRGEWMKHAKSSSSSSSPDPIKKETTLELAYQVMKGVYGSGQTRKKLLGDRYNEVQSFINHISRASTKTLVNETLKGVYGVGVVRKTVLGKKYNAVQDQINAGV